ncbi:HdeD family acid-resistance protein [Allomuricauda sp. d1]|uniref:HdeD family acid-resistance protein n=1 Tax=Allomuricauda sp. d1 TaxID=3136725 RepID=UPI0031E20231
MKNRRKNWWMYLLRGALFIIVAVLIFRNPLASLVGLTATIGFLTLFTGTIFIIGSITVRKLYNKWGWTLALGILDVLLGGALLFYPAMTAPLLVIFIGFWTVAIGMLESGLSFGLKKLMFKKWWVLLIMGILSILFGVVIIAKPLVGALSVTVFMGMQFLFYGSYLIAKGFQKEEIPTPTPTPIQE